MDSIKEVESFTEEQQEILQILTSIETKYILNTYDPQYTFLIENWNAMCTRLFNNKPHLLILVDKLPIDVEDEKEKERLEVNFNLLVERGYCIRRTSEFMPCTHHCGFAVITKPFYDTMKSTWSGFLPRQWKDTCSKCSVLQK